MYEDGSYHRHNRISTWKCRRIGRGWGEEGEGGTYIGFTAMSPQQLKRNNPMAPTRLRVGECTEYAPVELAEAEELFSFGRAAYADLQAPRDSISTTKRR